MLVQLQLQLLSGYSLHGRKKTKYGQFKCNFCGLFMQVERIFTAATSGPGSSVCIATVYGLDGPRIESRLGDIFRPGAHSASCTMGTGSLPGVKYGRGVLLTTHPLLVP